MKEKNCHKKKRERERKCLTLYDAMDYSLPGSVPRILQARLLEWVAIPFSRGPSPPGYWTQVCCTAGGFFTVWETREAHNPHFPSDCHLPKDRGSLFHIYFASSWAWHAVIWAPQPSCRQRGRGLPVHNRRNSSLKPQPCKLAQPPRLVAGTWECEKNLYNTARPISPWCCRDINGSCI